MHEEFAFGNADGFHEVGVSTEPDACAALLEIIACGNFALQEREHFFCMFPKRIVVRSSKARLHCLKVGQFN